jgi:hypothetical protein
VARTLHQFGKFPLDQNDSTLTTSTLSWLNLVFWSSTVLSENAKKRTTEKVSLYYRIMAASFSLGLFVLFDSCVHIASLVELHILHTRNTVAYRAATISFDLLAFDLICMGACLLYIFVGSIGWRHFESSAKGTSSFFESLVVFFFHLFGTKFVCLSWTGMEPQAAHKCEFSTAKSLVMDGVSASLAMVVMWQNALPMLTALPSAKSKEIHSALKRIAAIPGCLELCKAYVWQNLGGRWEAAISIVVSEQLDQRLVVSIAKDFLKPLLDDITIMALSREEAIGSLENTKCIPYHSPDMCILELDQCGLVRNVHGTQNHTHLE